MLGGAECSVKLLAGAPDGRAVGDELTVAHAALACFEVKKDDEDETVKVIVLSCWDEDSAALVGGVFELFGVDSDDAIVGSDGDDINIVEDFRDKLAVYVDF